MAAALLAVALEVVAAEEVLELWQEGSPLRDIYTIVFVRGLRKVSSQLRHGRCDVS
ncbi:hypothetical protein [Nonomuraea basaltis]|uniref:hypothetical protein n=1 Tax=Nonomuraea basaltis TaxID=2495887 RepID=UPI001F0F722F|nr:hypothetical protein [Nonomuraea basaltis]